MNCTVVITTFFSGDKLEKCINNIDSKFNILVIDNGCEEKNKFYFEDKFKNVDYLIPGKNLGVPNSYNYALSKVKTQYMFNTQPDVEVKKGCIEKLMEAANNYPNASILTPVIYHSGKYLGDGDFKVLKFINHKLLDYKEKKNEIYNTIPSGDLCVDAVTGTAMLIDTIKMKEIGGWDKTIFNYYEDMDICLRFRINGYEILKINGAEVDHIPFSSHIIKWEKDLDYSRNWHYSWSKIYFLRKYNRKFYATIEGVKQLMLCFVKIIVYFFNKKKRNTTLAKFLGTFCSLFFIKSYYRPNILKK
jgi:N-acetylglucosaminyl-diphospho-decaprenol L-rhamnosyltransferase